MAKVAINGLGRIGRATLRILRETPELELVAVNDIADINNISYLLRRDSVYGRFDEVEVADGALIVAGNRIPFYSERNPEDLPWEEDGVDIVFECTGIFTSTDSASAHVKAGAKYVIISAPAKDDTPTIVYGVNSPDGDPRVISCASCTTNSITPLIEIMGRRIGIEKAIMTTVHGYTISQSIVDGPSKKWERGRAGAINIVPTSTGAAVATTKALPQYVGKFDGIAMRVPTPVGSVSDVVMITSRDTSIEEVNNILREEAQSDRYRSVIDVAEEPTVSTDIIGNPHASVLDLTMTKVVDGNLVKVLAWYDNEWGYTNQMVRKAIELSGAKEKASAFGAAEE